MHRWFLLALVAIFQLVLSPAPVSAAPVQPVDCGNQLQGSWAFDGVYGPFTQQAVRKFQQDHHLTADGIAGPQTLKALGWVPGKIVLKCGAAGTTVQRLQYSLAKHGYWAVDLAARLDETKPSPKPQPARKPAAVAVKPTPRPTAAPTHRPAPRPTPTPWVEPSMAPTPSPSPAGETIVPLPPEPFVNRPAAEYKPAVVELSGGAWVNTMPSGTDSTYNAALPSWTYAAGLWRGNWGLAGELVRFNPVGGAPTPSRFFQSNTLMWDAMLKYRFGTGPTYVSAGYRQLTQSGFDLFTLGLGTRAPLLGDWLSFQARGLAGGNVNGGFSLDANTSLNLDLYPVSVGLGYRYLTVSRLRPAEPVYTTAGPTLGLTLGF